MRKQTGFTLIEIAIVLVIIGLLLGGVLKGQELIQSARVRNLISMQDGVKAAYFGFLDRYRALPGDYNLATTNIPGCSACTNGNNNGQIEASTTPIPESIAAWEHLSHAGFINGNYTAAATETTASAPTNPYARFLQLDYDAVYEGTATDRHNLKTGNLVPSDILAEIDRKIDDGDPTQGSFRASNWGGGGGGAAITSSGTCYTGTTWAITTPVTNCGGASLF